MHQRPGDADDEQRRDWQLDPGGDDSSAQDMPHGERGHQGKMKTSFGGFLDFISVNSPCLCKAGATFGALYVHHDVMENTTSHSIIVSPESRVCYPAKVLISPTLYHQNLDLYSQSCNHTNFGLHRL